MKTTHKRRIYAYILIDSASIMAGTGESLLILVHICTYLR